MIRRQESAGYRLLRVFVPRFTATASCIPYQYGWWRAPGNNQRIAVGYDCNEWVISACGDLACR